MRNTTIKQMIDAFNVITDQVGFKPAILLFVSVSLMSLLLLYSFITACFALTRCYIYEYV